MALSVKRKNGLFTCLPFRLVCLLSMCLLTEYNGHAQTQKNPPHPPGEIQQQSFQQNNLDPNPTDTILHKRNIKDNGSISKWKNSREFGYMRYLDSLLKKQTNLKADTVSIDEKSGRIKRNHLSPSHPSALNKMLNSWPVKIFFWLLAIIFLTFIIYKIFFKNGIWKRTRKIVRQTDLAHEKDLIEVTEYEALIKEAEDKNELNLCVRLLYLKTLKNLNDRKLISFTPDKTDKEYINELKSTQFADDFKKLVYNYEYAWYGKFLIKPDDYKNFKEEFSLFNSKM